MMSNAPYVTFNTLDLYKLSVPYPRNALKLFITFEIKISAATHQGLRRLHHFLQLGIVVSYICVP